MRDDLKMGFELLDSQSSPPVDRDQGDHHNVLEDVLFTVFPDDCDIQLAMIVRSYEGTRTIKVLGNDLHFRGIDPLLSFRDAMRELRREGWAISREDYDYAEEDLCDFVKGLLNLSDRLLSAYEATKARLTRVGLDMDDPD